MRGRACGRRTSRRAGSSTCPCSTAARSIREPFSRGPSLSRSLTLRRSCRPETPFAWTRHSRSWSTSRLVMAPDSLTVAVVWGRLAAIAEEMATALAHTAYSDQVREGGDFTTAVFDAAGRLLAQANRAPAHLGAIPHAVRHMLEYYPAATLRPGDVVTMNDPFMGAGHLPDFFEMSPVFLDDEIIGFVVGTVHVTDIGGSHPGSQAVVGVTEMVQEGL